MRLLGGLVQRVCRCDRSAEEGSYAQRTKVSPVHRRLCVSVSIYSYKGCVDVIYLLKKEATLREQK